MIASMFRVHASTKRALALLALPGLLAFSPPQAPGTWTPLAHTAPNSVNLMLLLSDGTVMCARFNNTSSGKEWYRLTPDINGSYVNGTWTTLAQSHDTRLYFQTQVLRDGRVFVSGGEYGTGGPKAEVYDPLTNVWTQTNPPISLWNAASDNFYDCNSEILADGSVMVMPVFPHTPGVPLIYDPASNTWRNAGQLFRGNYQDETSWVKLADNSILTIDPFGTFTERYIPAIDTWVDDGIVPVPLFDPFGHELGAGILLPDGRAFFLGSTGHTGLYTPTGNTSPGTWAAGPDIPGSHGTPDAPAAMMVDGKILCAVSPIPTSGNHFPTPTSFYEYDWVTNSFASINGPNGATESGPVYQEAMLDLPNGQVLWSHFGVQLQVYTPSGAPLAAGKPTITLITQNLDGSYHLVGEGLNGISEGASYGDDLQMNSNYPLVRLVDGANQVYYARTYNWSSTGVQTGSALVSTEFKVPAGLPPGQYSLVVVANGIASDPVAYPPAGCPAPVVYCTAKVNSLGCLPQIAASGTSSASTNFGFVITGANVRNNKPGLLIYGAGGRASTPFLGGLLCINGAVRRSGSLNSAGSTSGDDCTGLYAIDLNNFAQTPGPPTPLFALRVPGSVVNCQFWGRDPGFPAPDNVTLSDALEYMVCP